MNYFCDVHIQSKKEQEARFFLVLDSNGNEVPELKKEILLASIPYQDFCVKYKPKMLLAEYTVYETEEDINAALSDEEFIELTKKSKKDGQSELSVDCVHDKISGKKKNEKRLLHFQLLFLSAVC